MFSSWLGSSILKRAIDKGVISIETINIREFAEGRHKTTDDRPYGGGSGMVMKPEPIARAINKAKERYPNAYTISLSPQGRLFKHELAKELLQYRSIILLCGHYEGVDERIHEGWVDEEISIGDYVLTGGEPAAMVVIDAVARFIPGVLGSRDSIKEDSFTNGLLEYAQYTRPRSFGRAEVPEVLLSGNHCRISRWRRENSLIRTILKRPDLLANVSLSKEDIDFLRKVNQSINAIILRAQRELEQ